MIDGLFTYYLRPDSVEPGGENSVLFLAEIATMVKKLGYPTINAYYVEQIIDMTLAPGFENQPLSHDNMTGIVVLSKLYNFNYHKKYMHRSFWRRLHPRDIIFYLHNLNPIMKILTTPFLPIVWLSQLVACYNGYIHPGGILDTDGKILAWLRNESMRWTINQQLCNFILRKRFGYSMQNIFAIYFKDSGHPMNVMAKELKWK